jgi:hypothetical protein
MLILAMLLTAPVATPAGTTRAQNAALALALHRRMDANHDGYVTYAEMRAVALALFMPKGQPATTVKLPDDPIGRAEFERADTDHDGRISMEEAIAGADRAFDEADTNHDGVVSAEEHGAYAARSLGALQKEMGNWKPLPCQPGATCATARSGQTARYTAMAPADRLDLLDRFRDSLPIADRKRLNTALPRSPDGGVARCDHTEGSRASCEAAAYLPALRATDLLSRFLKTVPAR